MAGPIVAKISMDNMVFAPALTKLNTTIDDFCGVSFAKPERTSISDTLAEYENIFSEIENALKLYKQVLEKNSKTIKNIYDEISRADASFGGESVSSAMLPPIGSPLPPIGSPLPPIGSPLESGNASNNIGTVDNTKPDISNDFLPNFNR